MCVYFDCKYLVTKNNFKNLLSVFILQTPGHFLGQFNQFALERVFSDILGDTTFVTWTDDSRCVQNVKLYLSKLPLNICS